MWTTYPNGPREIALIKGAIQQAYHTLYSVRRWSWYNRRATIVTSAPIITGTISYTASTRELNFSEDIGSFDGRFYRIRIGSSSYGIDGAIGSSVGYLVENDAPVSNIASGTSYELYRAEYNLPTDFHQVINVYDSDNSYPIRITDRSYTHVYDARQASTSSTPVMASISNTSNGYGIMSLVFSPPPSESRTYNILYRARPTPLELFEYKTGTVTTSLGSNFISGTGTVFTSFHELKVIRFSPNGSSFPSGLIGNDDDNYTIRAEEGFVDAVGDGTSITTVDEVGRTLTDVKFSISDPVDIDLGVMKDAFLRCCEWKFSILADMDAKKISLCESNYNTSLILSMENDNRSPLGMNESSGDQWYKNRSVRTVD